MRVKLKKGCQKELIQLSKNELTWEQLSDKLGLSRDYVRNDLKNEQRLLSEEIYNKLCELSKTNFDDKIIERLADNWGKIKGASISKRNTKEFIEPKDSKELAEIVGIILGDGNIDTFHNKKGVQCYIIKIAGDKRNDKEYLSNYVYNLFLNILNEDGSLREIKTTNGIYLTIYGKKMIEFFKRKGLDSGDKKKNNQGIPNWIKKNSNYLKSCIRGLIDTDGSIHRISKQNKNLRINYVSHITKLLQDVREGLIFLGFKPSKIINDRQIFLSSKEDVLKFLRDIGFKNQKHLNRLELFRKDMPL